MENKFTFIDLFCGIGGIRIGFEKNGFKNIFSNDIEKKCEETYNLNFEKTNLIIENINKIDLKKIPNHDILCAGFPCQSFSIAGYRKGFKDKGRGDLFFQILKILKIKKPKVFLLENVKNLKSHNKGETLKFIIRELEKSGYFVKYEILNGIDFNVPQNRERIYIVGFLDKIKFNKFLFPDKEELKKSFKELLQKEVDKKYFYNEKPLYEKIKNKIIDEKKVYQWRRKYVRENKLGVVPTLTANMGLGGHNVPIIKQKDKIRKLTPRECFNFQGFPKNFKLPNLNDSTLYHQAGNSVIVPIIEKISKNIKLVLIK